MNHQRKVQGFVLGAIQDVALMGEARLSPLVLETTRLPLMNVPGWMLLSLQDPETLGHSAGFSPTAPSMQDILL